MRDIDCLIIAGCEFARLPEEWSGVPYIIACDKGYEYAPRLGLLPDIIIGDFDSAPYPSDTTVPVIKLPVRKDDTDTMFAVKYALEQGFSNIAICSALGGRVDHSFSNIQTALYIANRGGECHLAGADGAMISIFAGPATRSFPRREGFSFSVFSLTEKCSGVSIKGSSYDAEDIELAFDFPLGVSNSWSEDEIELSISSGIIMVITDRN